MTEIKILIYTDTKKVSLAPVGPEGQEEPWSVSILRDILEARRSAFVKFTLDVVNRYEKPPQPRKIDDGLLESYHQVWVFGVYQCDFGTEFTEDFGGPENELVKSEIDALRKWMQKGGILIAGDHSDPPPGQDNAPIKDFLCLGKALGAGVPRAGELRKWVGKPTSAASSSFNTLAATALLNETKEEADSDTVPQKLLLEQIGRDLLRHPIMSGTDQNGNDRPIDLFPDHIHEGAVTLPRTLGDDWPPFGAQSSKKPLPIIVARGCDKRHCRSTPVLAVYDPPPTVSAGRIIADSTWHHYLNINLKGLRELGESPAFFMLEQYYRHAAFFLAPLEERQKVSRAMLDWTLRHPEVWEEKNNNPLQVGKVALRHLSNVATRYEILEMLRYVMLDRAKDEAEAATLQTVDFPQLAAGVGRLPARELVVGSMIKRYYKEASDRLKGGGGDSEPAVVDAETAAANTRTAGAAGIGDAFRSHKKQLADIRSTTEKYLKFLG